MGQGLRSGDALVCVNCMLCVGSIVGGGGALVFVVLPFFLFSGGASPSLEFWAPLVRAAGTVVGMLWAAGVFLGCVLVFLLLLIWGAHAGGLCSSLFILLVVSHGDGPVGVLVPLGVR